MGHSSGSRINSSSREPWLAVACKLGVEKAATVSRTQACLGYQMVLNALLLCSAPP